jgi:hypothetical protein
MANKNYNNEHKNTKQDRKTLYTRILCFVLAALMVASGAYVIIEALL